MANQKLFLRLNMLTANLVSMPVQMCRFDHSKGVNRATTHMQMATTAVAVKEANHNSADKDLIRANKFWAEPLGAWYSIPIPAVMNGLVKDMTASR